LRIAVIDSTPLISLAHLALANKLSLYFDVIYVPSMVQSEVNRKHRFRYHLRKLYKTGFFVRCASVDRSSVELLRVELGEGEAEALIQAQEKKAVYFIGDEKRAREIGAGMGLRPVGTVQILARLHREDQAEETAGLVRKLRRDIAFRVTDEIVKLAIARAVEPI